MAKASAAGEGERRGPLDVARVAAEAVTDSYDSVRWNEEASGVVQLGFDKLAVDVAVVQALISIAESLAVIAAAVQPGAWHHR